MKTAALVLLLAGMPWRSLRADDAPDTHRKLGYALVLITPAEKPVVLECASGLSVAAALGTINWPWISPPAKFRLLRDDLIIVISLKRLRSHPEADIELQSGDILFP